MNTHKERNFLCGLQDKKGSRRYVSSIGVAGQYEYTDNEDTAMKLTPEECTSFIHHCEDVLAGSQWFAIWNAPTT